jgi:hypothetical protein
MLGEIFRIIFERQHLLFHEGAHSQAEILDLWRKREVHASFP